MKRVTYVERKTLSRRGQTASEPDVEVDGILLVGEESVLFFEDRHDRAGHDRVYLFPAVYEGDRAWLMRREWSAAVGYSAYGTEDTILTFDRGCSILIERGVFSFPADTTVVQTDQGAATVGTGDSKEMPPGLAEQLAGGR